MLDLAGIPLRAENRGEDDPLIIAGGPCAANPEPWAPFFDALFIGEAEGAVVEIAETLRRAKQDGASRDERLARLGDIDGVYLPSARTPRYDGDRLAGFDLAPGQPERVRRRVVADLNEAPVLKQPILPNARLIHDRLTVEVMRGCTRGCRFCQAGYFYRPVREREGEKVAEMITDGLAATGHDELSLLSLSTGDWTPVGDFLPAVMHDLAQRNVALSLPSLRVESLTEKMVEAISRVRRTGFTIAPEAATERLRRVINKPIGDDEVLKTVNTVFSAGWELVKLYFMIGLPTETGEDAAAIAEVVKRVFRAGRMHTKRARVNATISVFVPKPHTPFERMGMISLDEAHERLAHFPQKLFRGNLAFKRHDPEAALLEAAIARGDRRTADAIEAAYRDGARFDGWSEFFSLDRWQQAFTEAGLDLAACATRSFADDEALPWEGVDIGVSRQFLLAERDRALSGDLTLDCRDGDCHACGVKRLGATTRLAQTFVPSPPSPSAPSTGQVRMRVRYAKRGPARWLGHLELSSIFARAVRRADLPVVYSGGFHPQPRIAFGPPLAVGLAGEEEYAEMILGRLVKPEEIVERLATGLPEGVDVASAEVVQRDDPSLFDMITGWRFEVDTALLPPKVDVADAAEKFMALATAPVEVRKKGKMKIVDARRLVENAGVEGGRLLLDVHHNPQEGGLRPVVLIATVLGLAIEQVPPTAITRMVTRMRK